MSTDGIQGTAFKGVYKVTLPKVDSIKDKKERDAATDAIINTTVMGYNMSSAEPKIIPSGDLVTTYFKIDDKNDAKFENGFKNIIDNCNKSFNTDIAKRVYMEKVSEEEFNKN